MGTWYVDFCVDLPGNGASNPSCYLLSTALAFPEEEGMKQQSSVSISLSLCEPKFNANEWEEDQYLLPLEHCVGFPRRGRDDAAK